jgi:hypothetical protein
MSLFASHQVRVHVCPSCDLRTTFRSHDRDDYPTCWYCGNELFEQPTSYRDPEYVTVALYTRSRQYGGPEEGGWWYNEYDLVAGTKRSFLAEDAPQAEVYRETLVHRALADRREYRYTDDPYSVLVFGEDESVTHYPLSRPHYC